MKHHIERWATARDLDTERRYYNNWSPRSRTESIRYSIPLLLNYLTFFCVLSSLNISFEEISETSYANCVHVIVAHLMINLEEL